MDQLASVTLLKRQWPIVRPDRATIEELMHQLFELQAVWQAADEGHNQALVARTHRLNAAFLGLCTQMGDQARANWSKCNCNAMDYGGKVLSWLLEQGATRAEAAEAAKVLPGWLKQYMFPRAAEVQEKQDFSEAGEGA